MAVSIVVLLKAIQSTEASGSTEKQLWNRNYSIMPKTIVLKNEENMKNGISHCGCIIYIIYS